MSKPVAESVTAPIQKMAALEFADQLGQMVNGVTAEQIVNHALASYFQRSTPTLNELKDLGRSLTIISKMGIKWDPKSVPARFHTQLDVPLAVYEGTIPNMVGDVLDVVAQPRTMQEATDATKGHKEPTEMDRLKTRQDFEKKQLATRQFKEKQRAQEKEFEKQMHDKEHPKDKVNEANEFVGRDRDNPKNAIYAKLMKKGKQIAPNMYEIPEKYVTPQLRNQLSAGFARGLEETDSFYLRHKADVTEVPTDRGYILKDKRPDYIKRFGNQ